MALVPGLVDSHIHPFHGTDGTRGADLQGLRTVDEVRGALRAERARCAPGEWVLGWGLPYDAFGPGEIGAEAIADASGDAPGVPDLLRLPLGARQRARARAGRHRRRPGVRRGRRDRRRRPRRAHRRAARAARRWTWSATSSRSARPPQRLDAYAETLRRLNAFGLTGGHVMIGDPAALRPHRRARGARRADAALRRPAAAGARRHRRGDRGAARPARPRRPPLARGRGEVLHRRRDRLRHGVAVRARPERRGHRSRTGRIPAATRRSSPASRARASSARPTRSATAPSPRRSTPTGPPAATARAPHRIEHLETLRDAELARLRRRGRRRLDAAAARRGPGRARARSTGATGCSPSRWRRASAGATCTARARSSPSAATGPWSAPTRGSASPGRGCAGRRATPSARRSCPTRRSTAEQALAGYTTEAARIVGEEHLNGRIAPGLRADLTGLGADPVDCPADELPGVPTLLTVVDGEIVFRAE